MLVSETYTRVARRLLETGGFQLGLITNAQFLEYFSDVLVDFLKQTGLAKIIVTQAINSGVGIYPLHDREVTIDDLFVSGRFVGGTTISSLNNSIFDWRNKSGPVKKWHEDGLPIKQFEVVPKPNWTGTAYPDLYEIIDQNSIGTTPAPIAIPAADRNVTTYGTQIITYPLPPSVVALTVACNNPPRGFVGLQYEHALGAFGGTLPYTFSITSGSLPTGLVLDPATGIISGTPTVAGSYSFTVQLVGS